MLILIIKILYKYILVQYNHKFFGNLKLLLWNFLKKLCVIWSIDIIKICNFIWYFGVAYISQNIEGKVIYVYIITFSSCWMPF
jgi:hypothetical protein